MEKIIDYILVAASHANYEQLENNVKGRIKEGYQPFGSLVTVPSGQTFIFCQPMVKKVWNKTAGSR